MIIFFNSSRGCNKYNHVRWRTLQNAQSRPLGWRYGSMRLGPRIACQHNNSLKPPMEVNSAEEFKGSRELGLAMWIRWAMP